MSLKAMSSAEMVLVSGPWVNPGPAHDAIVATPILAALLPVVTAHHRALHETQKTSDRAQNAEYTALVDESSRCDERHDSGVRAVFHYLTARAALLGAMGESGDALLELRDFLLPEGLEHARKSYLAEAGQAELLRSRLTQEPAKKKALKDIAVGRTNILAVVEMWQKEAERLREIETEKAALATPTGPSAAELLALRNQWVRTARSFRTLGQMAGLDATTQSLLFGTMAALEKAATARAKKAQADAPEAPEEPIV